MAPPPTPPADWLLLPTHQALLAVRRATYEALVPRGRLAADVPGFVKRAVELGAAHALPAGRATTGDPLLHQPPLAVTLDDAALAAALRPSLGGARAVAATVFGPTGQQKFSNEDFALAATLADGAGRPWAFAAVADGVSTDILWSERAARIGAVVALHVARALLAAHGPGRRLGSVDLRAMLVRELPPTFRADRAVLDRAGASSEKAPRQGGRRFVEEYGEGVLYAATLLVSLAGPDGSVIVWAGDGGVSARWRGANGRTEGAVVLDGVAGSDLLHTWVGLGPRAQQFEARDLPAPASAVWLASDGGDNARAARGYADLSAFPMDSAEDATEALEAAAARHVYEDNYSVALAAYEPAQALRLRDLGNGRERFSSATALAAVAPDDLAPEMPVHFRPVPGAPGRFTVEYVTTLGRAKAADLGAQAPMGALVGRVVLRSGGPPGPDGRQPARAEIVLAPGT